MAYLHKFYLVVDDANFTAPTIVNNGLIFDLKKAGTTIASYVKGFITAHNTQSAQTYIYGESVTDAQINVALGDVITAEVKTIPSIGYGEDCTVGFVSVDDTTVSNIAISTDVSGLATTSDVNTAGNAVIVLLNGTAPLTV